MRRKNEYLGQTTADDFCVTIDFKQIDVLHVE